MPQTPPRKKSPAQLGREIDEVLRGKPRVSRPGRVHGPKKARAHATVKVQRGDKKQEEILTRANEAALSGQFESAEKILAKGRQRTIATSYSTTTPESAEHGDFADRGWVDEDGDSVEVTADDIEEQHETGSRTPVTDAVVEKAARWLHDSGATEASSTSYHPGVWYSSSSEVSDYSTGEERQEDFFLRNFTTEEERRVFNDFKRS